LPPRRLPNGQPVTVKTDAARATSPGEMVTLRARRETNETGCR
jgi:hypothetical protein